jgi:hypothetical protein
MNTTFSFATAPNACFWYSCSDGGMNGFLFSNPLSVADKCLLSYFTFRISHYFTLSSSKTIETSIPIVESKSHLQIQKMVSHDIFFP